MNIWKQYQTEITYRFAAVENLSDSEDTKYIKENIKTSATETLGMYKSKQHKPWLMKNVRFF